MVLQRSRLVRLVVAIALVALAAVGLRLSDDEDNFEVVRGVLGEPVPIHGGVVTASDVRVGTALLRFDEVEARTAGLFVVVRVQIGATGTKAVSSPDARVLSGDRRYARFRPVGAGITQPGFETSVDAVFEVDPAAIDDLTVELYPVELVSGFTQRVRVHLGITPGNADQWRTAGRDQVLEPAESTVRGI
jgi:hypothetical protein